MARAILSSALSQASGTIGDIVLRRHNGRTVLQKKPQRRAPWSRAQARHRRHFKAHADYAASVRADPVWRQAYAAAGARRKRRLNFYQLAVRDHANPPKIGRFLTHDFRPATGGGVRIEAYDDFKVTRAHVAIRDAGGRLLEAGEAECRSSDWHYTIAPPAPGASLPASAVVTVFDRPGNFAIGTFSLS